MVRRKIENEENSERKIRRKNTKGKWNKIKNENGDE